MADVTLTTDTEGDVELRLEAIGVLAGDEAPATVAQVCAPGQAPDDPVRHPDRRRALQLVVLAAPVVLLARLASTHRNIFVDGYIYLHVVQNILAGNGPVFNAGQRVEAFTSPVWTLLLSMAGFALPYSLAWIAVILGIMLSVGGLTLALAGSTRLAQRASPDAFFLPLGALAFVALPAVWSLATTGLETGLEFFWLGACLVILVRWSRTNEHGTSWWAAIVLGLGPLIRPELTLDSIVFITVVAWIDRASPAHTRWLRTIAWATVPPILYQFFRMGYYGVLVANTATAKEASLPRVGRGVLYFADFVAPYWLFLPAIALIAGAYYPLISTFRRMSGGTRPIAALLALPTAGLLNAVYIVVMGGDYIHARLFMGAYFAACAPVAAIPLARRYVISLLVLPWALLCAFSLRTADGNPWTSTDITAIDGHGALTPTHATLGPTGRNYDWYPGPGVYVQFSDPLSVARLDAAPAAGRRVPVIATSWIGYEPYILGTDVQILDLFGLADPLTAHMQLQVRGPVTGHEKPLPTPWIAAVLTADGSSTAQLGALQAERPHEFTQMIPPVTGHQLDVETAWARAALQCPAIRDIVNSPSTPLTPASFVANMFHSYARTTLRIPADPETAYHQFCGAGTPPEVLALGGH